MSKLPTGWSAARLADVAEVISGQAPPGSSYNQLGEGVPLYQGKSEFGLLYVGAPRFWTTAPSKLAEPGDVLLSVRAPVGPTNLARQRCAIGRGLVALRARRGVSQMFLLYWLRYSQQKLADQATGSTFPAISSQVIREHPVSLPPTEEQEQIVAAIEEEFSRLDAGAAALESARSRLQFCRIALLKHSFEPLVASGETAPLWEIATTQLGRMLSGTRETGRHAKPYLRNRDVQWGQINVSNLPTMDFPDKDGERFRLKDGDVLVCEGGEVGRSAVWRSPLAECYYQKAIHRVRCSEALLPDFLRYYFEFLARTKQFGDATSGMTIAHLPQEDLRSLRMPVPHTATQRAVVERLQGWQETERRTLEALKHLRDRANALRSAILASAFSGHLVPEGHKQQSHGILVNRLAADQTNIKSLKRTLISKRHTKASV